VSRLPSTRKNPRRLSLLQKVSHRRPVPSTTVSAQGHRHHVESNHDQNHNQKRGFFIGKFICIVYASPLAKKGELCGHGTLSSTHPSQPWEPPFAAPLQPLRGGPPDPLSPPFVVRAAAANVNPRTRLSHMTPFIVCDWCTRERCRLMMQNSLDFPEFPAGDSQNYASAIQMALPLYHYVLVRRLASESVT
jgi:hypothetical protein